MLASHGNVDLSGSGPTEAIIALIALSLMEIILGIDNIVFIAIITGRLPKEQQPKARRLGLLLALGMRILLLLALSALARLVDPIFYIDKILPGSIGQWFAENPEVNGVSWRDIIVLGGGLFLIAKSTYEIHHLANEDEEGESGGRKTASFGSVLIQIAVLDIVFSLDSVITAIGMAKDVWVMIAAVILAVLVMIAFADHISEFVHRNPTIKMLALSFLLLIGVMLVTEGAGHGIEKGYIYFAMCFSLGVEFLNMRVRTGLRPTDQEIDAYIDEIDDET